MLLSCCATAHRFIAGGDATGGAGLVLSAHVLWRRAKNRALEAAGLPPLSRFPLAPEVAAAFAGGLFCAPANRTWFATLPQEKLAALVAAAGLPASTTPEALAEHPTTCRFAVVPRKQQTYLALSGDDEPIYALRSSEGFSNAALVEECESLRLPKSGTRVDLVLRLLKAGVGASRRDEAFRVA